MRKKMYVEVIEPKSIALTKKQDKLLITYAERDESGDNRLSPFSKCEVWRIEIQLEGNLNRYKENFSLDEDELTIKIFKDFNKCKKIDFLNSIIEATEARLPEKPRNMV